MAGSTGPRASILGPVEPGSTLVITGVPSVPEAAVEALYQEIGSSNGHLDFTILVLPDPDAEAVVVGHEALVELVRQALAEARGDGS